MRNGSVVGTHKPAIASSIACSWSLQHTLCLTSWLQVNGSWNVNKDHIQHYVDAAQRLIRTFLGPVVGRHLFDLKHVLREYNKVADRLSNVAVDMQ